MLNYTLPPGLVETRFDDGAVWYRKAGIPIRSVSKILNRVWPMPSIDPWFLERGKIVHSATVLIDDDLLDWEALDERVKPFCDAYKSFIDKVHPIVEASELVVVHPSCTFGGRLDRVFRLPGQDRLIVCDIKTGTGVEDRYWCAVAAYALALDELNIEHYDFMLLNLDKHGKPHPTFETGPDKWIEKWRQILQEDSA